VGLSSRRQGSRGDGRPRGGRARGARWEASTRLADRGAPRQPGSYGWTGLLATIAGGLLPIVLVAFLLESGAGLRALLLLVVVPGTAWLSYRSLFWSRSLGRWIGARLAIARARRVFREALAAARRHPEIADIDALRDASRALARHLGPQAAALPEVQEAAQHPYAPIRRTATRLIRSRRIKTPGTGTATPDNLSPGNPSPDGTRTPWV